MTRQTNLTDEELIRLRHGTPEERASLNRQAEADPDLAARLAEWDRQDAALRLLYAPVADEPVPERLTAVLRAGPTRGRRPLPRLWQIAAAAVLLGLGFGAGWWTGRAPPAAGTTFARAAMGSYTTYAVEVAHPVEVPAAEEAHLVTWLSKRLGQPIHVPDLASAGFRLIGGRLLPGPSSPAALLMYEDGLGRRLALYVTRSKAAVSDLVFAEEPGAQAFWWIEDGLGCALAGDLPRDTLRQLAVLAYHDLTET